MANDLAEVTPKLLAQGLRALRENAVTPQLVNREYEALAAQRGATIDVPIPSMITSREVEPSATAPDPPDLKPTSVPIQLNKWQEAPFQLSDREQLEVMEGTIPMQASEAIKSLANDVDNSILGLYDKFFGFHGTPGTTPFSSGTTRDATQIRKVLNNQLAPMNPRWVVFDADAEAQALDIRAFQDMSFHGDAMAIIEGRLERRLGFGWVMNQNIMAHTAGTATGTLVDDPGGGLSPGDNSVNIDGGTGTFVEGDIITFGNHDQTYVVTAAVPDASSGTLQIEPGLVAVPNDNDPITRKDSHVANLAFHRDAIALATRPLQSYGSELGVISRSAVDPISGLTLRLQVTYQNKRLYFSYDILWGVAVIRRELGARLAG